MGEWEKARVGDFFELVTGYAFKSKEFKDTGVPVIKIKNVKAREFSKHEFSYVDQKYLSERANKVAQKDDLLISMSGNRHDGSPETWVGKVCHFGEDTHYLINQRVGALRLKKNRLADVRFFGFLLSGMPYQETFIAIATSSGGQANLSPTQILGAPVRYPNLMNQRRIGELLGTLDDKIELNRRMNETLEAMARALFKDWFVDFGPTRAKAESRDPYLAPEIWDLFPDKLDEDGKPEGWEDSKVEDYLELAYGKSLPAKSRRPGGVAVYGSGGLTGFHDEALIKGPAVIVGRKGTVGSLYWEDRPIFPIDTVFYVVPKRASLSFCYQLLLSQPLAHMNTDAAVPGLNRNNAYRLEFPWPGSRLTNTFESFASPLWKKRTANLREIDTLSQSRDLLLPKLMSGKIRVGDADKIVKEFT